MSIRSSLFKPKPKTDLRRAISILIFGTLFPGSGFASNACLDPWNIENLESPTEDWAADPSVPLHLYAESTVSVGDRFFFRGNYFDVIDVVSGGTGKVFQLRNVRVPEVKIEISEAELLEKGGWANWFPSMGRKAWESYPITAVGELNVVGEPVRKASFLGTTPQSKDPVFLIHDEKSEPQLSVEPSLQVGSHPGEEVSAPQGKIVRIPRSRMIDFRPNQSLGHDVSTVLNSSQPNSIFSNSDALRLRVGSILEVMYLQKEGPTSEEKSVSVRGVFRGVSPRSSAILLSDRVPEASRAIPFERIKSVKQTAMNGEKIPIFSEESASPTVDLKISAYSWDGSHIESSSFQVPGRLAGVALTDTGYYGPQPYKQGVNGDSLFVINRKDAGFFVGVFDGLGGVAVDRIASMTAARAAEDAILGGASSVRDLVIPLNQAFQKYTSIVYPNYLNETERMTAGSGTTLMIASLQDKKLEYLQKGDARLQVYRGGHLVRTSKDQSPRGDVIFGRIAEYSRLFPDSGLEEYLSDPGKPFEEVLTQSELKNLKDFATVSSVLSHTQLERSPYDNGSIELSSGDWVILGSDGVFDAIKENQLNAILAQTSDPAQASKEIRQQILENVSANKGKKDNVSFVLFRIF